jgi:pimeloyl-ACP methyl ester carboxylesterase
MEFDTIQYAYIESGRDRLFGCFHDAAAPEAERSSVLICPPWGWDEVACYRPRRAWAQRLAAAGHPTLRFDLPATGNSTGDPGDEGVAAAWCRSVEAAAGWLGKASGGRGVTAIGMGLGGLLVLEAQRLGAPIDDVVLWNAPIDGREFVREARSFARLLARLRKFNGTDDGEAGSTLPEGWLEVSGFALSAETINQLERIDPLETSPRGPRRALLIARNRSQDLDDVAARLEALGAEVERADGRGWGPMVADAKESQLPDELAQRVEGWLSARPGGGSAAEPKAGSVEPREVTATDELDDGRATERPISLAGTFAILAAPSEPAFSPDLCAVFLNAGAVRNIGTNRMWVERSRAWAARGIACVRIDLEDIGEGAGEPDTPPPGNDMFSPRYDKEVARALDAIADQGLGSRFLLVGLCLGAYQSLQAARADRRVSAAVMINPVHLVYRPELYDQRQLREDLSTFDRRRIAKLFRGEVGLRRLRELVRSLNRNLVAAARSRMRTAGERDWAEVLDERLDEPGLAGVRLTLAFSGREVSCEELEARGFPQKVESGRWPNLRLVALPGNDHTLRPTESQMALAELLDSDLESELEMRTNGLEVRQ